MATFPGYVARDIVDVLMQGDYHDFDRNASHSEDRYVCMCEHVALRAADEITRLRKIEAAARKFIATARVNDRCIAWEQLEELLK